MRIISQSGNVDIQYDQMYIERVGIVIVGGLFFEGNHNGTVLAEYSTQEKAEKAMELLRKTYTGRYIINADVSEDFDKVMQETMKHGFGTVIVRDSCNSRVEFDNLNGYFQFPKDEDVEV